MLDGALGGSGLLEALDDVDLAVEVLEAVAIGLMPAFRTSAFELARREFV